MLLGQLAREPELQQLPQVALFIFHDQENVLQIRLIFLFGHDQINKFRYEAANSTLGSLAQSSHNLNFPDNFDTVVLILREIGDQLDSQRSSCDPTFSFVDQSEAPLAQLLDKFVVFHRIQPDLLES